MGTITYGWHLILDCYGANPRALHDVERIYRLLDRLPGLIDMEKIGPPQLAVFDDPTNAGITGIIMIVTSHISIHTYSKRDAFFMDVFSCKAFDKTLVIEEVKRVFEPQKINEHCLERGDKFPERNLHD